MRVPLLAGSRLTVVDVPPDADVLRPPPPDRDARGRRRGGARGAAVPARRAFPRAARDPRRPGDHRRRATRASDTERRPRSSTGRAGCGGRRARERRRTVGASDDPRRRRARPAGGCPRAREPRSHELARRFSGKLEVHDADDPDLVEVGTGRGLPLRVNRALVETDVVLASSPRPRRCSTEGRQRWSRRATQSRGVLRPPTRCSRRPGRWEWRLGSELEREIATRVPLIGASLTLNLRSSRALSTATRTTPERSNGSRRRRSGPHSGLLPGRSEGGCSVRSPAS